MSSVGSVVFAEVNRGGAPWQSASTASLQLVAEAPTWQSASLRQSASTPSLARSASSTGLYRSDPLLDLCSTLRSVPTADASGLLAADAGGWRAALKDPQARAAMRALKRRVESLQGTQAPSSHWAHRVMNRQDGRDHGPRLPQLRCSAANSRSL